MILLPKHRPPTSPGRLLQCFLKDYELTQSRLAELTDMQLQRINQIVKGKRGVTPDTALRLSRLFGTTPDLWLNAQLTWDLWHAKQEGGTEIEEKVTPLTAVTGKTRGRATAVTRRVTKKDRITARSARPRLSPLRP